MGTRQESATGDKLLGKRESLSYTGRILDYRGRAEPLEGRAEYGTAASWWNAAWREGNLVTAGLNFATDLWILGGIEDSPVVDEKTGLTRFEVEFNKDPAAFLGQYADYTDDFPGLLKVKSLGELNYRKFMVSRDVRERAVLSQSGFSESLLPYLMIGSLSPENWIPITSAARLGFLGKGALGMKPLHKMFPKLAEKAAAQADEIMDEAFVQAAKKYHPGITMEKIKELAIKRLISQSPLSHKVGATAIEGMLTAAVAEPFYHMDMPLRTKEESAAIIIGSGVLGGGFGLVFGGIGSAYGKVLRDKLGVESVIDFNFSIHDQIGREVQDVAERLDAEGLPSMLDTLGEELGAVRRTVEDVLEADEAGTDVLEQVSLDALDNPLAPEVAQRRVEIINEVLAGRDPDSPISKLIGLGNDNSWFGKLLARTMMWSPNLRSAWTITATEDMLYQRLGANAMTKTRGTADALGDLTEPSMDTAETLASMEGLRRVIALGDVYNSRKAEMGNLTEDEFRSLTAKAARREEGLDPEEEAALPPSLMPEQSTSNKVYDLLEGKTPEQTRVIIEAVEEAVKDHYNPYITEVTKIFKAVGMIPDSFDDVTARRHAARYVTRQYDKSLIKNNNTRFKGAVKRGLEATREAVMPTLEKRLEDLDKTLADYRDLLIDPEMTVDELNDTRAAIEYFDSMRVFTQDEMNALNVLDSNSDLDALLDQVIRNITDENIVPGRSSHNALESSLMSRVLDLEDKFIEPYLVNDIGRSMTMSVKKYFPRVVAFRYLASSDQIRSLHEINNKLADYDRWYDSHRERIDGDILSDSERVEYLGLVNDILFELNFLNMHNGLTTLGPTRRKAGHIPVVDGAGQLDLTSATARVRALLEGERVKDNDLQAVLDEMSDIRETLAGPAEPAPMGHPRRRVPRQPRVAREANNLAHPLLIEDIANRVLIDHADEVARRKAADPTYQASATRVGLLAHEIEQTFDRSRFTPEEIEEIDARIVGDAPAKVRQALDDSYNNKKELHRSRGNEDGSDVGRTVQNMTKGQYLSHVVDKVLHTRVRYDKSTSKYIFPTELTDIATPKLLNAILDNSKGGYIYNASQAALPRGQHLFNPDTMKSIIQGFNKADASSALHEQMHAIRKTIFTQRYVNGNYGDIKQKELDTAANWSAEQAGEVAKKGEDGEYIWTRKMEEAFADGFEVYIQEGTAPTTALKRTFEVLASILKTIYENSLRLGHIDLSPEMRSVYDKVVQRGEFLENNNHPVSRLSDSQKQDVVRSFNLNGADEIGAVHTILDSMGLEQEMVTYESPTIAEFADGVRKRRQHHERLADEAAELRNDELVDRAEREHRAANRSNQPYTDEDGNTHWQRDIEWHGDIGVLRQPDDLIPPELEDAFRALVDREDTRLRDAEAVGDAYDRIDDSELFNEAERTVANDIAEATAARKTKSEELSAADALGDDVIERVQEEIDTVNIERVLKMEEAIPAAETIPEIPEGEAGLKRRNELPLNRSLDTAGSGRDRGFPLEVVTLDDLVRQRIINENTSRGFAGTPNAWATQAIKKHRKHLPDDISGVKITDLNKLLLVSDVLFDKEFAESFRYWVAQQSPQEILTSKVLKDLVAVARGDDGAGAANQRLWSMEGYGGTPGVSTIVGTPLTARQLATHLPENPAITGETHDFMPGSLSSASTTYFVRDAEGNLSMVGSSSFYPHGDQRSNSESVAELAYNELGTDLTARESKGIYEALETDSDEFRASIANGEYYEKTGLDGLAPFGAVKANDGFSVDPSAILNERIDHNQAGMIDPTMRADEAEALIWAEKMDGYSDGGSSSARGLFIPMITGNSDTGFRKTYQGTSGFSEMLSQGLGVFDESIAWQVQFAPNTYYKPESNLFLAMLGMHIADGKNFGPIVPIDYNSGTVYTNYGLDIPATLARGETTPDSLVGLRDILGGFKNSDRIHGSAQTVSQPGETIAMRASLYEGVRTELQEQGIKKVRWTSEFDSGSKLEFGIETSQELRDLGLGENVGVADLTNVDANESLNALTIALQRMRPYNPVEIAVKLDLENSVHADLVESMGMEQVGSYHVIRAESLLPGMTETKIPLPDYLRYTTADIKFPLANKHLRNTLASTRPVRSAASNKAEIAETTLDRERGMDIDFDPDRSQAGERIPVVRGGLSAGSGRGLPGEGFRMSGGGLTALSPYHQAKSAIHGKYVENPDGGYVRTGDPVGFNDRDSATFLDTTGDEPVLKKVDDIRAGLRDLWLPHIKKAMTDVATKPSTVSLFKDRYPHLGELVEFLDFTKEQFLADFEKAESMLKERKGMAIWNVPDGSMGAEAGTRPYKVKEALKAIAIGDVHQGQVGIYLEMAFELAASVGLDRNIEPLRLAIDSLQREHKRLTQTDPEWMHVRDKAQAVAGGMVFSRSASDGMFGGGNPRFELSDAPILARTMPDPGETEHAMVSMKSAIEESLSDHRPPDTDTALPALERLDPSGFDQLPTVIRDHLAEFNNDEHSIYALSDGSGAMAINHDGVVVKLAAEGPLNLGGESSTVEPSLNRVGTQKLLLNMAILNGAKGIILPGVHPDDFVRSSEVILAAAELGFIPIAITGKGAEEGAVPHAVMALHLFGGVDRQLDSTGKFEHSRQDAAGLLNAPSRNRQKYEDMIEKGGRAEAWASEYAPSEYRAATEMAVAGGRPNEGDLAMGDIHHDVPFMHAINNPIGSDSSIDPNTLRHAVPRMGHIFSVLGNRPGQASTPPLGRDIVTQAYTASPYAGLREIKPESATDMIVDFSAKNNIGRLLKKSGKKVDIKERIGRTEEGGLDPAYGLDQDASNRGLQPFFALAQDDIPDMNYNAKARRKVQSNPEWSSRLKGSPEEKLVELGREQRRLRSLGKSIEADVPVRSANDLVAEWRGESRRVGRSAVMHDSMNASRQLNEHIEPESNRVLRQAEAEVEIDTETQGLMDRLEALQDQASTLRREGVAMRKLIGDVARDMGTAHDSNSGARSGAAAYTPLPQFKHRKFASNMDTVRSADGLMRIHLRKVKGETFKDGTSLESQFIEIEREYAPLLKEAEENGKSSTGHTYKQLMKRKRVTKKDAHAMVERVYGTHGHNTDASEAAMRFSSTARDFNYMRMMGGVALSSLPDIAMAISTAGLRNYMGAWGEFLKGNLTRKDMDSDGMSYLMYAAETVLGDLRSKKTNMIDEEIDPSYSLFERGIRHAAHKFGRISGIQHWNGSMKAIAASALQSRMLEIGYKIERGVASDLEKEMLRQFGISPEQAKRAAYIHKHVGETGRTSLGKEFHHTRIDRWEGGIGSLSADEVARSKQLWRMGVVQAVNRTIVTPGVGDLPLIATGSPWGKMLFQFKSFTLAATQQVLISGIQRGIGYGDMSQLMLLCSLTSMGSMVYTIKELMAGRDPFGREDWLMKMMVEGVDRGGALGVLSEINQITEKVAGYGLSNLTDSGPLTRYMRRNKLDAILGPTYGLFGDLLEAGGVAPQWLSGRQDIGKGQATAMRRLLPWQNLLQTRFLLDVLPNAAGRGGYFDNFKNMQERIRSGDYQ